MAFYAAQHLALARGEGAQGNALIQLAMRANDGCFANDHARCMVNKKVLANGCARRNVNARYAVCVLAHQARNQRHVLLVQHMSNAVYENGEESGVAQHNFLATAGSGVAIESGLHVFEQQRLHVGQFVHECFGGNFCALGGFVFGKAVVFVEQCFFNLRLHNALNVHQTLANQVLRLVARRAFVVEIAGKHQNLDVVKQVDNCRSAGEMLLVAGEEMLFSLIAFKKSGNVLVKFLRNHRRILAFAMHAHHAIVSRGKWFFP